MSQFTRPSPSSMLEINLAHLKHNFQYFRGQLSEKTKILAVVKASAYGNGSLGIAQFIEEHQLADYFGVAHVQEGIELREAGIRLPIMVLNPRKENFPLIIKNNLELEINHFEHLKSFEEALAAVGNVKNYPIHLKFNTGMNRLGFNIDELPKIIEALKKPRDWSVAAIMTHLSASNLARENDFSYNQLQQFDSIWEELKPFLPKDCIRHALNSNGILYFPKHHYDMVRLGVGMYGGSEGVDVQKEIKEIATFKTKILQLRKVQKGETIGYSRAGKVQETTNIAAIAVGYFDGFSRCLGNGKWEVEIAGKLYPTIGNVCMDMTLIDVGNDEYKDGEEVILFGGKKSIHQYAEAMDTISYEAMCRIGVRVERVFIKP